jgi:hypothetical protein
LLGFRKWQQDSLRDFVFGNICSSKEKINNIFPLIQRLKKMGKKIQVDDYEIVVNMVVNFLHISHNLT